MHSKRLLILLLLALSLQAQDRPSYHKTDSLMGNIAFTAGLIYFNQQQSTISENSDHAFSFGVDLFLALTPTLKKHTFGIAFKAQFQGLTGSFESSDLVGEYVIINLPVDLGLRWVYGPQKTGYTGFVGGGLEYVYNNERRYYYPYSAESWKATRERGETGAYIECGIGIMNEITYGTFLVQYSFVSYEGEYTPIYLGGFLFLFGLGLQL